MSKAVNHRLWESLMAIGLLSICIGMFVALDHFEEKGKKDSEVNTHKVELLDEPVRLQPGESVDLSAEIDLPEALAEALIDSGDEIAIAAIRGLMAEHNELVGRPTCCPQPIKVKKVHGTPKRARLIRQMMPGESGYTVPWAFDPDTETLNSEHTVYPHPRGTVQMRVDKTEDGYEVHIPEDYEW